MRPTLSLSQLYDVSSKTVLLSTTRAEIRVSFAVFGKYLPLHLYSLTKLATVSRRRTTFDNTPAILVLDHLKILSIRIVYFVAIWVIFLVCFNRF